MISGASEEELDIAHIRADIMIALDEKYGNYDLLDKLDKYQEKERQKLISFLKDKINHLEDIIYKSKIKPYGEELRLLENSLNRYQEVLDFINTR